MGDLGSIPGLGRFSGGGNGYPLYLEKETATHSSILAWGIPWTEKPDGLQSMGLQRVGHNRVIFTDGMVTVHIPLVISKISIMMLLSSPKCNNPHYSTEYITSKEL